VRELAGKARIFLTNAAQVPKNNLKSLSMPKKILMKKNYQHTT